MSNHDGYCAVADVSPVSRLMAHDGALSGLPNLWIPFCVELMHGTSRDDSAMVAAFAGLSAHLVGAWLLLSPSLLRSCLPGAALSLATAISIAAFLWLPCLLLRPWLWVITFDEVLRATSFILLNIASAVLPKFRERAFFAAFRAVAPERAAILERKPVVNGLAAQLRALVFTGLTQLGVLAALVGTAPLWAPVLVALAVKAPMLVALALTPFRIALAVGSLALGSSLLSSLALPWKIFLKLRKISLMLAAVVALGALSGILPPRAFQLASELGTVYLLSQLLTKQLLSPYSSRQTRAEWSALCERHHYELAAFGAPLVGLFWYSYLHPLVSLGMLEGTQLGAAALVHALEERAIPLRQSRRPL